MTTILLKWDLRELRRTISQYLELSLMERIFPKGIDHFCWVASLPFIWRASSKSRAGLVFLGDSILVSAKALRLGGEVHEKPSNKSLLRAEQKPNCLGIRCAKEEKKVAASVHWYSQNAISLVDREVLEHWPAHNNGEKNQRHHKSFIKEDNQT